MKRNPGIAVPLALFLALAPVGAGALELSRDDGSFESVQLFQPGTGLAVDFDLPTADPYTLSQVRFYLGNSGPQTYNLTLSLWDAALAKVFETPVAVAYTSPGWYAVDLTAAALSVGGPFRVGLVKSGTTGGLFLGADTTPPFGHSWMFNDVPVPPWNPLPGRNVGIRATVEPAGVVPPAVPALACEGFAPPLNRARTLRKGGRTLPLKARLFDDAGFPVGADAFATPPAVQVLFTPEGGVPADVTAFVTPAGRSNAGTSFRLTDTGWWRYNLKSRSFAAAGSYEILLVSGDPAEYVVDPGCSAVITVRGGKPAKGPKR